jgi:NO-binding membrane sensor protein with MHYT domain
MTVFALFAAAFSIGVNSVWIMHFINTSAVRHGVKIQYNLGETVLSLIFILGLAFVGITIAACHRNGLLGSPKSSDFYITRLQAPKVGASLSLHWIYILAQLKSGITWQLALGGALLGVGVGAMHYTGVNAVRANLKLVTDPVWALTSVPIAAVGGMAVLWLMFHMHGLKKRIIASLILGVAVSSVHFYGYFAGTYTGLPAGEYHPDNFAGQVLVEAEPAVVAATLMSSVFRFLFLGIISAGAE